ncbi:hypothetical protein OKW24_000428 [Peribacillus simplex]|nr:hypothetical protein [Peribacillus simplex]MDF9758655.1 hypothetical protein [Peribacillus simplex]
MKRQGIINSSIAKVLADLGHMIAAEKILKGEKVDEKISVPLKLVTKE